MKVQTYTQVLYALGSAIFAVGIYAVCVATASAQSFSGAPSMSLVTTPTDPGPNEQATVLLDAYAFDTTGATITWYIDGVEQTDYKNARSIVLQTGDLGDTMSVKSVISIPGAGTRTVTKILNPSVVDIVLEGDTMVPLFYKGRALPSARSTVYATALPHTGTTVSDNTLYYTWKLGSSVILGGTTRGLNAIVFQMPENKNTVLSVVVTDANGNQVGSKSIQLVAADTLLRFYEDNPLRGESRKTIGDNFALIGEETTVRAEPYFVSKDIFRNGGVYEWSLNGAVVQNPSPEPQLITLRQTGTGGTAKVGFKLTNTQALMQRVYDTFTIFFE